MMNRLRTTLLFFIGLILIAVGPQSNAAFFAVKAVHAAEIAKGMSAVDVVEANDTVEQHDGAVTGEWIIRWKTGEHDPRLADSSEIVYSDHEQGITVAKPRTGWMVSDWVEQWRNSQYVEYIQANHKVQISALPNDELYRFQSHLPLIGAEAAWDHAHSNSTITIAVVDTGVALDHPDLQGNLVAGTNLLNPNTLPEDDHGHGTSVSGVIAAVGNNRTGISGAMWNAKIMPIKALDEYGSGDEDKLGRGIRYAVDNGAKIVVLSLGLYKYSNYMQEVVNYAESKGVLLVAASGNAGKDVKYPAAYPTVLAVGGMKDDKTWEPDSNFGPELDVVAPWSVFTTSLGGAYDYNYGTSMAAPQVAAAAALIWAKNPDLKPYQVRNQIRQSAEDIGAAGWDEKTGYGLLRIDRALTLPYKEDIYEPNNSSAQAKRLSIDNMISASLSGKDDEDWFQLQAPYDGKIRLEFQVDGAGLNQVEVWHVIQGKESVRYRDVTKPVEVDLTKGRSYLRVKWNSSATMQHLNYRLTTKFTIYRDAFEDNDRQFRAYLLPQNTRSLKGTFHHLNDQDWFAYEVKDSGSLQFKVTTDTNRMDLAMYIQKEGERAVYVDYGEDGEPEISERMEVLPGKYFIRITNESSSRESHPVTGEYTLSIDYVKKLVDPNEPNDKSFQATAMSLDTPYQGLIDKAGDDDWFSFKINQSSYSTIEVTGIPLNRTLQLELSDSTLKLVRKTSNPTTSSSIRMSEKLERGTYYIKLTSDQSIISSMYELKVKVEPLTDGYRDIANSWAKDQIVELTQKNIVTGYTDYTFRPKNNITRAEVTALLVRTLDLKEKSKTAYTDVGTGHWAYDAIHFATQAGLVQGTGGNRFQPDRPVTRSEMAAMVARALKLGGIAAKDKPFQDVDTTHWASGYIETLKAGRWILGYPDGTFRPDDQATREEFVALIYQIVNRK